MKPRATIHHGPATSPPDPHRSALDAAGHATRVRGPEAPRSSEAAEARYVAARDEWTRAMRAANSGRPADLAWLAIAQQEYEAATAERDAWVSGGPVAIPIDPEVARARLEAAVGQELAWHHVRTHHEPETLLGRLKRRITGR